MYNEEDEVRCVSLRFGFFLVSTLFGGNKCFIKGTNGANTQAQHIYFSTFGYFARFLTLFLPSSSVANVLCSCHTGLLPLSLLDFLICLLLFIFTFASAGKK